MVPVSWLLERSLFRVDRENLKAERKQKKENKQGVKVEEFAILIGDGTLQLVVGGGPVLFVCFGLQKVRNEITLKDQM